MQWLIEFGRTEPTACTIQFLTSAKIRANKKRAASRKHSKSEPTFTVHWAFEAEGTEHSMFSLQKRRQRLRRWCLDVTAFIKYLQGCHTVEDKDISSLPQKAGFNTNELKLQKEIFGLNSRENLLMA